MVIEYWNKKFQKQNYFGIEPTDFAVEIVEFLKERNVKILLDLGCGQGRDSTYLSNNGFQVTALDFSKEALKSIKDKKIKIIQRDMKDLSIFKEKTFEVIYSNLALHFLRISELKEVIKEINRILISKGYLIFRIKSPKDKYSNKGNEIEKQTFIHEEVIRRFYTKKEIKDILKNNFKIIKIEEGSHIQFGEKPSFYWTIFSQKLS